MKICFHGRKDPYGSLKTLVKKAICAGWKRSGQRWIRTAKSGIQHMSLMWVYGFLLPEWIKSYLPEDPEQRSRAWELACFPVKREPAVPGWQ